MTSKSTKSESMSLLKKISKIVPLSLLTRIYTRILSKTPIRKLVDAYITSRIPPEISLPEGILILNPNDAAVSGMIAMGMYEPFETQLFRETIKKNMVVIDIGANIGFFTVIAAQRVGVSGSVFAFEPEPTNFGFLKKTCEKNHFKQVILDQRAISDTQGSSNLFITPENTGAYSLVDNRKTGSSISIKTETLDRVLASHSISSVDIIKMDIEGAEFNALKGMQTIINSSPDVIMFTEFFPKAIRRFGNDPLTFLAMLQTLGFTLSIIDEDEKRLKPIQSIDSFMAHFPKGESAVNLYASKRHK